MKRISWIIIYFSLALFFLRSFPSLAQEELTIKKATVPSELSKVRKSVEYTFPYPGLLPDSPLYFLKVSRDAVVGFLISDPLKKADFDLLQADKRLNAGVYLIKKGVAKYSLVESTISKGENYFEKAISKTQEAKKQGMDIADISSRLYTASKKHQEIIKDLETSNLKIKESLRHILKRVAGFEKQAETLIQK